MDNILLALNGKPSLLLARQFRLALGKTLEQHGVPENVSQKIKLCLSEVLSNLVTHTNPLPSEVIMRFIATGQNWSLNILDDSIPWDPTQHYDDDLLTEFSELESGRGTALINSITDNIAYTAKSETTDNDVILNTSAKNKLTLTWQAPIISPQKTILLVEDERALSSMYQHYLEQDFIVITAGNGIEALSLLTKHNVDLVLSDIKMPKMNGLSLRKKMNQKNDNRSLPFIFMTAQDDHLMQEQATALGIDDYLIKPIKKPQLLSIIHRVLGRSNQVHGQLSNRINENISSSLQPNIPKTSNGWNFALACRNTGKGGGDLLLHKRSNDNINLVLADIMGHDDSAKFFAYACGGFLHGLMAAKKTYSPAPLLEQLSEFALTDNILSQITLTCCALQLSSQGKFTIASAGHPEPLHITSTGIYNIDVSGMMLGLIPTTQYDDVEHKIQYGDRVAIFTDGLFESALDNQTREYLTTRMKETLYQTLNFTIEQSLQKVMAVFDEITNNAPIDDTLLLLIELNDPNIAHHE
jgi:CheY-like chemotaxis protein/anti-sigma regulatory factor (Ser/Thr protein kinase)